MRRDHFTVTTRDVAATAGLPTLDITYTGPTETLTRQLTDSDGTLYDSGVIDAAFRLQDDIDADATGVFSLAHRVTGEFLLEANADADVIFSLVDAARDADDAQYRLHIEREDADAVVYNLEGLFVYDADGQLRRKHSLVPSGVEL